MAKFIAHNNKILVDSFGRLVIPAKIPSLEFEIESTEFPPTGHEQRRFEISTSSLPQKIYIDFGDGSPEFSESFVSTTFSTRHAYNGGIARVLKNYPNANRKIVKIRFDYPEKISQITVWSPTKWQFVGDFPLNIGLYNLSTVEIRNTNFNNFPIQLSGGTYTNLVLYFMTDTNINYIPKWIYNSRIANLSLLGGVILNDVEISNLNKLINIPNLNQIYLNNNSCVNSSFPTNLKDISTLRLLSLGNNPIIGIPTQVNACKQITELSIGYRIGNTEGSNPSINSWGVGVANMPNLKTFSAQNCSNVPTDIVTGIETSGINTIQTSGCYRTVSRVDASILSALNKVNSLASKTVGNTLLRNITWVNGRITSFEGANEAPTGVYQAPLGFILGTSNGTPANAMEMIYVLTKQYRWTITINLTNTITQTYNYLS